MPKSLKPSLRDVAEVCGVSSMTVSYILNNKPNKKISRETRDRVFHAVREIGYVLPSVAPNGRGRAAISTLGVVSDMPGVSLMQPYYFYAGAVLRGVLQRCDELQLNVILFAHSLLSGDIHRSLRAHCDGRSDGLFVIAPIADSPLIAALQERGTPFVVIGNSAVAPAASSVDVDDMGAGESVTDYLIGLGHRRIAYVNGPDFVASTLGRDAGYRKSMSAHGLEVSEGHFVTGFRHEPENTLYNDNLYYLAAQKHMSRAVGERPTALFCFNDNAAERCLHAVHDLGLRVPEDVSIVGFDDHPFADTQNPPLTTVRQPYQEIGTHAVDMLLSLIKGTASGPMHEKLDFEIVRRASVQPWVI